ncbi:MAG TPA: hypothetical protein ENH19_02055 [Actinobacteria bacterium]|nr:hypothetical protein [Actinomycetes bacterium]HEX21420.1 hypothetical protein [Actinomycetota bacterium]
MKFYHTTTKQKLNSIKQKGLLPNSSPTWFNSPTPYIMLSPRPWPDLNGEDSVILEVEINPSNLPKKMDKEGLRWPYPISSESIKVFKVGSRKIYCKNCRNVSLWFVYLRYCKLKPYNGWYSKNSTPWLTTYCNCPDYQRKWWKWWIK